MYTDDIKLLFEYNNWADARILAACARVSPDQYIAPTATGTGHGGLRATMVHILDSMWQDRITLQGYYKDPLSDDAAYDATELHEDAIPTFAALQERWAIEQQEMRAYLDTLTDETLNGTITYVIPGVIRKRVVWHFLLAALFHNMQHRSEAAVLLTAYGHSPGNLEFTLFLDERGMATT